MVALSIGAILLAMALPSLRSMSERSRLSATVNTLVFSLQAARSEAIKRSETVILCASVAPLDQAAACDSEDYATGWIVYVDVDADGVRSDGERLIQQEGPTAPGIDLGGVQWFAERVAFTGNGTSAGPSGAPLRVVIEVANAADEQRIVIVAANGHIGLESP